MTPAEATVAAFGAWLSMKQASCFRGHTVRALQRDDYDAAEHLVQRLKRLKQLRSLVAETLGRRIYIVIPLHLILEAYRLLLSCPVEALLYFVGPAPGCVRFAQRILLPEYDRQSVAGVGVSAKANLDALMEAEKLGDRLIATVHSHPGRGRSATSPSSTDMRSQTVMEALGYLSIGCIFSRDGWFRFYSHRLRFTVIITAPKGRVQRHGNVLRLAEM